MIDRLCLLEKSNPMLSPPVCDVLEALDYRSFFWQARGQRHPLSSFRLSCEPLVSRLAEVATKASQASAPKADEQTRNLALKEIAPSLERLIYAASAFEDTCQEIVLGLFSSPRLAKESSAYRRFERDKRGFNSRIGRIAATIKHHNGQIVVMHCTGRRSSQDVVVPGYFVEAVDPETGAIGPSPRAHPNAIAGPSLNWELRYLTAHVYLLSHWMGEALSGILDAAYENTPSVKNGINGLADVAREIAKSPALFFPNEEVRATPFLIKRKLPGGTALLVGYGSQEKPTKWHLERVHTTFSADLKVEKFQLPIFRERPPAAKQTTS